jgi:hypothetical protein
VSESPRISRGQVRRTNSNMVSELEMQKWAVLSERGCEAADLTHEEARRLVHGLAGEGLHGLCIVTDQAARRIGSDAKAKSPRRSTTVPG